MFHYKLRKDTAEESIRQDVARSPVEEYDYETRDVDVEYPIKMGRAKKRVDTSVFFEGKDHNQENIYLIIEAKHEGIKPSNKQAGVD